MDDLQGIIKLSKAALQVLQRALCWSLLHDRVTVYVFASRESLHGGAALFIMMSSFFLAGELSVVCNLSVV